MAAPPLRLCLNSCKGESTLKRLLIISAALLMLLALAQPSPAQHKDEISTVPFSKAPYQVGEQLTYHVMFSNFVDAAHVELLVAAHGTFFTRDGIQLRAHIETT